MIIKVTVEDSKIAEQVTNGGDPLRSLCREEVERFHQYLQNFGGIYKEGLANFERLAVEGYLYQKIRGHIDGFVWGGPPK